MLARTERACWGTTLNSWPNSMVNIWRKVSPRMPAFRKAHQALRFVRSSGFKAVWGS